MPYFTTDNSKIKKSLASGYLTFGIHFAPAKLSKYNVCSDATEGCEEACLNLSGHGAYPRNQEVRIAKTNKFLGNLKTELPILFKEVEKAIQKAKKHGLIPCFRLNLTSDIPFEKLKVNGKNVFETFPDVQFYDYTKSLRRMALNIPNYHLTFSRAETSLNQFQARLIMNNNKHNVAVVFNLKKGQSLPETWLGKQVVDGDKDDLRFLDPKGCVVGLRAKGKAKKDKSGFVVQV